jgi:DNA-binding CsgD family transcriptional regulator
MTIDIPNMDCIRPRLTPAEQRTARGIFEGLSNKEIARKHGISERTVEGQRRDIYEKMKVNHVVPFIHKVYEQTRSNRVGASQCTTASHSNCTG